MDTAKYFRNKISYPLPEAYFELLPCSCHKKYNLPMFMEDYDGTVWVECDFCGNKTKKMILESDAVFRWNLFQRQREL